jgi:hypothetical protein
MTIPALMNCPHREDSWCLDCTAKEWETHRAEVERLKEAANRAAGIIVTMPTHGDTGIIDALQRAVAALRGEEVSDDA